MYRLSFWSNHQECNVMMLEKRQIWKRLLSVTDHFVFHHSLWRKPRWKEQGPKKRRDQLLEILEDFLTLQNSSISFRTLREKPKQKSWLLQCEGGLPGGTRLLCVFCFCCCHQTTLAYGPMAEENLIFFKVFCTGKNVVSFCKCACVAALHITVLYSVFNDISWRVNIPRYTYLRTNNRKH